MVVGVLTDGQHQSVSRRFANDGCPPSTTSALQRLKGTTLSLNHTKGPKIWATSRINHANANARTQPSTGPSDGARSHPPGKRATKLKVILRSNAPPHSTTRNPSLGGTPGWAARGVRRHDEFHTQHLSRAGVSAVRGARRGGGLLGCFSLLGADDRERGIEIRGGGDGLHIRASRPRG
jgi:hypothetical protein